MSDNQDKARERTAAIVMEIMQLLESKGLTIEGAFKVITQTKIHLINCAPFTAPFSAPEKIELESMPIKTFVSYDI